MSKHETTPFEELVKTQGDLIWRAGKNNEGWRENVEAIVAAHQAAVEAARAEELKYIRDHASGGGSWRRVIEARLKALRGARIND